MVVAQICSLTNVTYITMTESLEEVNAFPISPMITQSFIGPNKLHVTMLALACVMISSVRLELVAVSMLGAAIASK